MRVEIAPARTRRERDAFVRLPFRLHAGDERWVPPLISERKAFLNPRRNPFFAHADVALWVARRSGRAVGRISSHIDHLHNQVHGERTGMFGFFEAADEEAGEALLGRAAEWVKERGMSALRGPLSFSLNHECGLIVEGFEEPPVFMMPYNPPAYAHYLHRFGFGKAMDLLEFRLRRSDVGGDPGLLPQRLVRVAEKIRARAGVTTRPGDMRRYREEMRAGLAVYNRGWRDNWGFVPIPEDEFLKAARDLKPLVDPRLSFVAESGGEIVGIALNIRDLNQVLPSVRGRLLPFGWLKLVRGFPRISAARLLLFGVQEEHWGRGAGVVLVLDVLQAALAHGYDTLELCWILENNERVLRIIENLGGPLAVRPSRRYRIFEMPV